jgi:TetR/AcrR family transcriptional regulator, tetracycline repressor protein
MPLDRDLVVTTALELLNDVGLDHFTTRKLAERLGVKQPALYWHFRNKRELLDEMASRMLHEDASPSVMTADTWMESLRDDMRRFRAGLLRYRDGARVHAGTRPDASVHESLDVRARAMCDAGFTPDDAIRAFKTLSNYVVGAVMEEQAAIYAERDTIENTFSAGRDTHPTLTSAMALLVQETEAGFFEFGLDTMLAGLAAKITARRQAAGNDSPRETDT